MADPKTALASQRLPPHIVEAWLLCLSLFDKAGIQIIAHGSLSYLQEPGKALDPHDLDFYVGAAWERIESVVGTLMKRSSPKYAGLEKYVFTNPKDERVYIDFFCGILSHSVRLHLIDERS